MKKIQIGRSTENNVVLKDDLVSGKHLIISQDEQGSFFLQDLNSTNGTWLNGELIKDKTVAIRKVDKIRLGNTDLDWLMYFEGVEVERNKEDLAKEDLSSSPTPQVEFDGSKTKKVQKQTRITLYIFIGLFVLLVILLVVWYMTNIVKPEIGFHQKKMVFSILTV